MLSMQRFQEYARIYGFGIVRAQFSNALYDYNTDRKLKAYSAPGYILATRMRSGSIWMRSLLFDYETLLQGGTLDPSLSQWLAHYSPQIEVKNSVREFRLGQKRYSRQVVKTHLSYYKLRPIASNKKIMVLFRRPEDTFTEQFLKQTHHGFKPDYNNWSDESWSEKKREIEERGVDEYAIRRANKWLKWYRGFEKARQKDRIGRVAFTSYESMIESPVRALSRLVAFYDYPVVSDYIDAAIENRRFEKVKSAKKSDWDDAMTGRGTVGVAEGHLNPQTIAEIRRITDPMLAKLRNWENEDA